jgi:hypothetical protein
VPQRSDQKAAVGSGETPKKVAKKTIKREPKEPTKSKKEAKQERQAAAAAAAANRKGKKWVRWREPRTPARVLPINTERRTRCFKLVRALLGVDQERFFALPVDLEQFPEYALEIKKPMDLGTVQRKLRAREAPDGSVCEYAAVSAFAADVRLVVRNCLAFNAPGSGICRVAHRIGVTFERLLEWWVMAPSGLLPPIHTLNCLHCQRCGLKQVENRKAEEPLLDCDGCCVRYHASCLVPPLLDGKLPSGRWQCACCVTGSGEHGASPYAMRKVSSAAWSRSAVTQSRNSNHLSAWC